MINYETTKQLIWDRDQNKMVTKIMVYAQLVGNANSVFAEEGPLYCENGHEVFQASQILRQRLISNLSMP